MRIDVLTLFPEMFESVINSSVFGRAVKAGILEIHLHNIRDYTLDKHRRTDDYPFGGGAGMVMTPQPLFDCFDAVCMSCELGLKKPSVEIYRKCTEALSVECHECIYVGDGGSYELETAQEVGMHPIQALWYWKDGVNHPIKINNNFIQADSPTDILDYYNGYKTLYSK